MKTIKYLWLLSLLLVLFACGEDAVYYEKFGWEEQNVGDDVVDVTSVFFVDSLNGWICGSYYKNYDSTYYAKIFRTTDGGETWESGYFEDQSSNQISEYLRTVYFLNRTKGWAAGNDGRMYYSEDGGRNWNKMNYDNRNLNAILSIKFIDEQIGWAIGWYGKALKTTDGGENWEEASLGTEPNLSFNEIVFANPLVGWIVGGGQYPNNKGYGRIFKTEDGGETWYKVHQNDISFLYSIDFVGENLGFACGENGFIIKTTDGGDSWNSLEVKKAEYHISDIQFLNSSVGYACGYYSTILKTTDGGDSWQKQTSPRKRENFYDLFFLDEYNGWIGGTWSTLLHTDNGGVDVKK